MVKNYEWTFRPVNIWKFALWLVLPQNDKLICQFLNKKKSHISKARKYLNIWIDIFYHTHKNLKWAYIRHLVINYVGIVKWSFRFNQAWVLEKKIFKNNSHWVILNFLAVVTILPFHIKIKTKTFERTIQRFLSSLTVIWRFPFH